MIKSFKIRLFPTKEQEELMWKHVNSCRFIWNYMLEKQISRENNNEKPLSAYDMINLISPMKQQKEFEWLKDVSNSSLCKTCLDLGSAFSRFFKKQNRFPKFKSKKDQRHSCPARNERLYFVDDSQLFIEKIGKIKYKSDLSFSKDQRFLNVRLIENMGKWFVYFVMKCENQAPVLTDKPMGIDLGIKETMVVAYGNESIIFHNINKSKKVRELKKRIRNLQRVISRKYEANRVGKKYIKTNNIIKLENKLRRLYARLNGIRHNYIHQCTHELISLLPCRVVMEDLNIMGMMKNKYLSKAIQEQCFYEIIRQMKYKCEWNGIPFIQVDRFYPSSKTCSCCGSINKKLTLSDRTFICPDCGFTIDRDYQAALNLMRYEV